MLKRPCSWKQPLISLCEKQTDYSLAQREFSRVCISACVPLSDCCFGDPPVIKVTEISLLFVFQRGVCRSPAVCLCQLRVTRELKLYCSCYASNPISDLSFFLHRPAYRHSLVAEMRADTLNKCFRIMRWELLLHLLWLYKEEPQSVLRVI